MDTYPRRRVNWVRLAMAGIFAAMPPLVAAAVPDDVALGEQIYRQGILPDGSLLAYRGAGGTAMVGRDAACAQCHRRSGMGGREGRYLVPPITGAVLYGKPQAYWPQRTGRKAPVVVPLRHQSRAAYDDMALVRAITAGVDASGRPLNELMPRYALDARAGKALVAYLRQLAAAPVPGVATDTLHLATIVTPDADPVRSRIVVDALSAWAAGGGVSRLATPLQVWRLEGPEATWGEQLGAYYRRQPVFAVISGAGGARWRPVRDFCEQAALPCLFPIVDLAPSDHDDNYSLYFSNGVALEARLLVRHLQNEGRAARRLIQLVGDAAGAGAAEMVTAGLAGMAVETRHWRADQAAPLLADLQPDDLLVSWLPADRIAALTALLPQGPGCAVLFSDRLAPPGRISLPAPWRGHARWLSARTDPRQLHGQAVLGLLPWAERHQLALDADGLLAEVYAATYFFTDALARLHGAWNREYLVETLEAAVDNRPAGGAFYGLSLGPGQRVAAKGGHLLGYAAPDFSEIRALSPRIVP